MTTDYEAGGSAFEQRTSVDCAYFLNITNHFFFFFSFWLLFLFFHLQTSYLDLGSLWKCFGLNGLFEVVLEKATP